MQQPACFTCWRKKNKFDDVFLFFCFRERVKSWKENTLSEICFLVAITADLQWHDSSCMGYQTSSHAWHQLCFLIQPTPHRVSNTRPHVSKIGTILLESNWLILIDFAQVGINNHVNTVVIHITTFSWLNHCWFSAIMAKSTGCSEVLCEDSTPRPPQLAVGIGTQSHRSPSGALLVNYN